MDDAYISYQYTKNLVSGHRLVFNVGEYVEGYTNLLWVLLIATGMKLGFDAVAVGHFLCILFGSTFLFSTWLYAWLILPKPARWVALFAPWALLSFNSFVLWGTSAGLETPLFATLIMLALSTQTLKKPALTPLFCTLATIARPIGALLAAALLGVDFVRTMVWPIQWKKSCQRCAGACCLQYLSWPTPPGAGFITQMWCPIPFMPKLAVSRLAAHLFASIIF